MSLMCGCDERAEVYEDKWPKANKEHQCVECHKIIMPGEIYCRTSMKTWGGGWSHHKTCEKCQDLIESMMAMGFCFLIGELWDAHAEYLEQYAPPKIEPHRPLADHWTEMV
jgi:RNA polymerase subunit RPABC4/transcription elongation factor Spt4